VGDRLGIYHLSNGVEVLAANSTVPINSALRPYIMLRLALLCSGRSTDVPGVTRSLLILSALWDGARSLLFYAATQTRAPLRELQRRQRT
jgi:hypothetical protein